RQDGLCIAGGAQSEDSTAVVEQVEFHVAATAYELLVALGGAPRRVEVVAHQLGINAEEGAPDLLREGEIRLPVRAVEIIVKNPADSAHLLTMAQVEVLVAPALVLRVRGDARMGIASPFHRRMKGDRIGIVLPAAPLEYGCQIRAAAEPGLSGHHEPRVHVDGRHVWILRMGDERNAGSPKARIDFGPGNVFAEFRRKLAEYSGHMHAD